MRSELVKEWRRGWWSWMNVREEEKKEVRGALETEPDGVRDDGVLAGDDGKEAGGRDDMNVGAVKKGEAMGVGMRIKGVSLRDNHDKDQEVERKHNVDNLKTEKNRQHSDIFILRNTMKVTKTVREMVNKYEGWGKESAGCSFFIFFLRIYF